MIRALRDYIMEQNKDTLEHSWSQLKKSLDFDSTAIDHLHLALYSFQVCNICVHLYYLNVTNTYVITTYSRPNNFRTRIKWCYCTLDELKRTIEDLLHHWPSLRLRNTPMENWKICVVHGFINLSNWVAIIGNKHTMKCLAIKTMNIVKMKSQF